MTAYIPPHLRNNKNMNEKRVRFNDNQTSWNQTAWNRNAFTKVNSYRNHDVRYLEDEIDRLENKNASLEDELDRLKNKNISLKDENHTLKEQIDVLNRDVKLYKGNREECVPKSSFDAAVNELKKIKSENYEYSRKLKDIDDVHRNDTSSLRTEINVLKEELKKSEKQISHLSSNVTSLSNENKRLQEEVIELIKTPKTTAQESVDVKEENKGLIQEDWNNIKTSLKYLLSDAKLKKQFIRDTGINPASMKMTLDIIENY